MNYIFIYSCLVLALHSTDGLVDITLGYNQGDFKAMTDAFRDWLGTSPPIRDDGEARYGENLYSCDDFVKEFPVERDIEVCEMQKECSEPYEKCHTGCFFGPDDDVMNKRFFIFEDSLLSNPDLVLPRSKGEKICSKDILKSLCNELSELGKHLCMDLTASTTKSSSAPSSSDHCISDCRPKCLRRRKCMRVKSCRTEKQLVGIEERIIGRECRRFV